MFSFDKIFKTNQNPISEIIETINKDPKIKLRNAVYKINNN